jgi:predicted molibdopterin-dependent oxidoreductase YjgC
VAGLVGHKLSNEALFLFRHLFREYFRSPNVDHRFYKRLFKTEEAVRVRHNIAEVNTSIADLEKAQTLFLFGGNLAEEQPIVYLRVRKAWRRQGACVVVASSSPTEAETFARLGLRFRPGTERFLLGYLAREIGERKGMPADLRFALEGFTLEQTSRETGIAKECLQEAVRLLEGGFVTVASRSLYDLPDGLEVVSALANLSVVSGCPEGFNLLSIGGNEQGCLEVDLLPQVEGKNTQEILQACAEGEIRALWLVACDPLQLWYDRSLVERALESVEFLVVQDYQATEALPYASVVLPCAAFSEQEGTYTNGERRVQYVSPILPPPGEAKPAWRIFSEVELRLTRKTPPFHSREVLGRLAETFPAFEVLRGTCWEKEGAFLGTPSLSGEPRVVANCYPEVRS